MKPIFEEERLFLNEILGIELPKECWRSSSKIYLDCTCEKPIYKFKVEDNVAYLTKDDSDLFRYYKQKTISELQELYKDKIDNLVNKSIEFLYEYMFNPELNHINDDIFVIGHSSGKDSTVNLHLYIMFLLDLYEKNEKEFYEILDKTEINFANTSNDTGDTYRFIKSIPAYLREYIADVKDDKLVIMNPKEGWTQWIKRKNYYIPTTFVRNCCSTYKEGQINKQYDKDKTMTHFIGVRKYESTKRAKYDYIMDYEKCKKIFGNANFPKTWTKACPIVEWHDEEIWLYILRENLAYNDMYNKGFQRVGCLLCPYQSNYNDLLIQRYYPKRWEWWMNIIEKNYEYTGVEKRLHWTLEEYQNGRWKTGISKVQKIITKKYTEERAIELSQVLGISLEMAKKYWNRNCECGKKMNPTEIAMFYKLYGRYEGMEDMRKPKCKKCVCEDMGITSKEYQTMYLDFRENGCNLF